MIVILSLLITFFCVCLSGVLAIIFIYLYPILYPVFMNLSKTQNPFIIISGMIVVVILFLIFMYICFAVIAEIADRLTNKLDDIL